MIDKKDIEKLAALSRMKLTEEEKDRFAKEIDSILGHITQLNEVVAMVDPVKTPIQYAHRNVLREDVDDRAIIDETSVLVDLAPEHQDNYVKVKKILG